jgi:threonyl-tRNA synthetase
LGTIQVDYNLPKRFDLEYIGADNQKHRPVMIHRAPFGSMERFVAILIENCGGNFPLWLAPDQVAILPLSERFKDHCDRLMSDLEAEGITGFVDHRDEKIGKKIRDAEILKIPYMLIIGEKEANDSKVSVRKHGEGDLGQMSENEFMGYFRKAVDSSMNLN